MRHNAEVFLWGTRIGIVTQGDTEPAALFEYDRNFLQSGIQLSPIAMPLSRHVYTFTDLNYETFHGLPGLLADSLPDKFGNAVIDAWLSCQKRLPNSFTAIERLCYTGTRGMGALEYRPAQGPEIGGKQAVDVEALVELASCVLARRMDANMGADDVNLQSLLSFGTSAGGARAKAVVAWNAETGEVRSGQVDHGPDFGQWILKFDGVAKNGDREGSDPSDYTRTEYAYYLMAKSAGVAMNECRLFAEGPRRHFMARRFDRDPQTGRKVHMQTLGALAHWDYRLAGAYSYEQVGTVCMQLGLPQADLDELFRRMAFNVLAVNCDDHVKNISFLMDRRGVWRLAPAYDVTFAYNPNGTWTNSHQMCVNGKRWNISLDDLLNAAREMNVERDRAKHILADVEQALAHWEDFAAEAGLGERRASNIKRLIELQCV